MKIYNVVVIGCGHMGKAHLEDIYFRDDIRIYGVADICEEKARLFAKRYGALSYSTDFNQYIRDSKVDIVIVATYPSSHLDILKKCIENGKHVLCEKPITTSLEDGEEFVRLVKSAKSKVLVGHILRHNESYKKIGDMLKNGAIGKPIIMRMVQNHHTIKREKYLKLIEETSPIIDCGIHYIDVMRWFTGAEITNVSGVCQRLSSDIPEGKYDYGIITAKLSDGSVAYYEAGWSNTMASSNVKEFVGPRGRISLTFRENRYRDSEEGDLIEYYRYPEKTYETININCKRKPTWEQFKHLISMIEEGTPAVPSIDDVFRSFYIAVKADEAIRKSITIDI